MNGFLKIAKAKGQTSFDVVKTVRRIAGIKKVGHSGTLDPMATGLLILGLGTYTKKLSQYLDEAKCYEGEMIFGFNSDTYDMEGVIHKKSVESALTREDIEHHLPAFRGEIMQVPPRFSAKKVNGKKAYQLARKGEAVELSAQKKHVYEFEILRYESGLFPVLAFRVRCSSGTYIRSLAHDLGQALGVGATLSVLNRTKIGDLDLVGALSCGSLSKDDICNALF